MWLCYQRCCGDDIGLIGVENNMYSFLIRPTKLNYSGENFSVLFIISSVKEKITFVVLFWGGGEEYGFSF